MSGADRQGDTILITGAAPIAKVAAAGAAGAVTTIAMWALGQFAGVDLPQAVAAAFTVLLTVGAAYFKR